MVDCGVCHKKNLGLFSGKTRDKISGLTYCSKCTNKWIALEFKLNSKELASKAMKALGEDSGLEPTINKIVEGRMPLEEASKLMESKLAESLKIIEEKRIERSIAERLEDIKPEKNERRFNALKDAIGYYRKLGFFKDLKGLDDEDVLSRIIERAVRDEIDDVFSEELTEVDVAEIDFYLLFLDKQRYFASRWLKSDGAFVEIIEGLAKISSSVFKPVRITEKWESDEGPIRIEFTHGGKNVVIKAEWQTKEWPDIEILKRINPLIASKGYVFVMVECPVTDGPGFMLLSTEEKRKLEKDRGWKFLEKN